MRAGAASRAAPGLDVDMRRFPGNALVRVKEEAMPAGAEDDRRHRGAVSLGSSFVAALRVIAYIGDIANQTFDPVRRLALAPRLSPSRGSRRPSRYAEVRERRPGASSQGGGGEAKSWLRPEVRVAYGCL